MLPNMILILDMHLFGIPVPFDPFFFFGRGGLKTQRIGVTLYANGAKGSNGAAVPWVIFGYEVLTGRMDWELMELRTAPITSPLWQFWLLLSPTRL